MANTRKHVRGHGQTLADMWTSGEPEDRARVRIVLQAVEEKYSRALAAYTLLRLEDQGQYTAAEHFFNMLCETAGVTEEGSNGHTGHG